MTRSFLRRMTTEYCCAVCGAVSGEIEATCRHQVIAEQSGQTARDSRETPEEAAYGPVAVRYVRVPLSLSLARRKYRRIQERNAA